VALSVSSLGLGTQRRRKKVSGKNKTEVKAKLAELHDELNDGIVTNAMVGLLRWSRLSKSNR